MIELYLTGMAGLGGGQPSTPTTAALDGAEVARRMMMATEAASVAAQAAAAALERRMGGGEDRSWFKILQNPLVSTRSQGRMSLRNGGTSAGGLSNTLPR